MANITISIGEPGVFNMWDTPGQRVDVGQPFGEVTFANNADIALKIDTNQQMVSLVLLLPPNFVWRLVEARIISTAPTADLFTDVDDWWTLRVVDSPLVGPVTPRKPFALTGDAGDSYQGSFGSVTNDFNKQFYLKDGLTLPGGFFGPLGSSGSNNDQPAILGFNMDTTADETVAYNVEWYFRCLAYTIEQERNSPIHNAVSVKLA